MNKVTLVLHLRQLHLKGTGKTLNHSEFLSMIERGEDVTVLHNKTGKDMTHDTLVRAMGRRKYSKEALIEFARKNRTE